MKIEGNIIDIRKRQIYFGKIFIENGKIKTIQTKKGTSSNYILPGFTDAHIHIESSMLIPSPLPSVLSVKSVVPKLNHHVPARRGTVQVA